MDYTLRENRKSLACSHLHADSVRERVNAGWRDLGKKLKDEIFLRHYSHRTFQAYLAVKKQVSASAQNQAFNALLFLFRHVLKKEL
ncbi:MAG: phage integrase N-terminal SAM-like domain-containing protein, partial [Desulfobacteria bacterium]